MLRGDVEEIDDDPRSFFVDVEEINDDPRSFFVADRKSHEHAPNKATTEATKTFFFFIIYIPS
ncbi:hypothetical protein FACS189449_05650 [Alphaproteobacteria bacterium]|nr:hypothetical protein FACS189449_05650 [Alphaproteobacteria bacterium]